VTLRPVFYVFALCLISLGLFMLVPLAVELAIGGTDADAFLAATVIAVFFGGAIALTTFRRETKLSLRQAFLLTPLCWFLLPLFGAIPFLTVDHPMGAADAYFEAVSGLTTTGATVLSGLDSAGRGLLIWRAILQWLGGIGIIMMAIAILPLLRVGGMQIMRTESSDRSDKVLPRASQIAGAITGLYFLLTLLCALGYWLSDMTPFEAVAHALTTISTAGYSTSDGSLGAFSAAAQWNCILFMLMGAVPFVLLVRAFRGDTAALTGDSQVRAFFVILAAVILPVTVSLYLDQVYPGIEAALRAATFNIVSIVTTTGFATGDYQLWGDYAVPLFFFLMLVGGCTGSTTGGVKVFRWQIMVIELQHQLASIIHPHRVIPRRFNGRPLPDDVPLSVGVFVGLFLALVVIIAIVLAADGLDFVTALSASLSALTNVGPALGPTVGPAGNFGSLSDFAKWLLAIGMILGRLELLTVLVLLDPRFWEG